MTHLINFIIKQVYFGAGSREREREREINKYVLELVCDLIKETMNRDSIFSYSALFFGLYYLHFQYLSFI
jgi:hypothetical protein